MHLADVAALFDIAVAGPDPAALLKAAEYPERALEVGTDRVRSAEAVVRSTACDLLGLISNLHEAVRERAAAVLLSSAAGETDHDVLVSAVRALGRTSDVRVVPFLIGMAGHPDSDLRLQVAQSLPFVMEDFEMGESAPGVATLIELTRDNVDEVRNWATFGLGRLCTADGPDVRRALWDRVDDSFADAREEGILGLARRRDTRATPLVAALLAEESAAVATFVAAALVADAALVPLLENFDPADPGVSEALLECDPARRLRRDAAAVELLEALSVLDADIGLVADRFEPGLLLELGDLRWSVEGLLGRADHNIDSAVRLVAADLSAREGADGVR